MNCIIYILYINAQVIRHMTPSFVHFLQVYLFPSMWAYGHWFHTKEDDYGHLTQDCGVEVNFDHSRCDSNRDRNMIRGKLFYVGKIQEIIQVDFSYFQCLIFRCGWWDASNMNNVKEDRDSVLICINSRKMWDERTLEFFQNTTTNCSLTRMLDKY